MDNKKYTAMDIANYIVNLVNVPDKKLCTLTHIKLQKILYYVQATYMAKNGGTPLFTNDIEKWQYGPVVREVYSEFKDFGISHINTTRSYLVREEKGNFQLVDTDICAIENDINISSHIKEVFNCLKDISAFDLVDRTHEEPMWKDLKHEILSRNNVLKYTSEEMTEYFTNHPLI